MAWSTEWADGATGDHGEAISIHFRRILQLVASGLSSLDPAAKKLVWIGGAQHAVEPSKKPEKNQERLNKGAQKLLKDFPPGR